MSDILFYFSDYVITIYVITSRAIIATPSVRRTVRRCVRLSPSGGHTPDIQRTNAGQIYGHRTQRRTVPSCEHHISCLVSIVRRMPQTTGLGRFLQTVTTAWRLIMKCTLNQFIKATKSVKPCNSAVIEFQAARPMTNENTFLRISLLVAVCLRVGVKKFLAEIDLTKTHLWHTSLVKKAGRLVM